MYLRGTAIPHAYHTYRYTDQHFRRTHSGQLPHILHIWDQYFKYHTPEAATAPSTIRIASHGLGPVAPPTLGPPSQPKHLLEGERGAAGPVRPPSDGQSAALESLWALPARPGRRRWQPPIRPASGSRPIGHLEWMGLREWRYRAGIADQFRLSARRCPIRRDPRPTNDPAGARGPSGRQVEP